MNRPARFTVLDLVRATKAAQHAGPDWAVEVDPNGTIRIVRKREAPLTAPAVVGLKEEIVLW